MRISSTLRRAAIAVLTSVAFLSQGTWVLAGTTGNLGGSVRDTKGAPVAGVEVQAVSPSQTATTTTDASGHFIMFSLAPDTYTLNLTKSGYQPTSIPGAVVFADQTQQYAGLVIQPQLKTIGRVSATAGNTGLVKSGVGGDIYNVNAQQQAAAAQLGGGGSLDSMYSAIASVPGLAVGTGGAGWNQAVVIRGQNPWTSGFEFDGVPVNRAFDNYNASTGSNLGLQELQVYTGGGPGSISSSGISGFINQVIKTGTYPGYASLYGSIGTQPFYHSARAEIGGATPDRNFTYYIGISGYNQTFQYIDNSDGSQYMQPNGGPYAFYLCGLFCNSPTGDGVLPTCNMISGLAPAGAQDGCNSAFWGLYNLFQEITDRENVINLHFGIPRKDGLKDDIQMLWSASALKSYAGNSNNQVGYNLQNWTSLTTGLPYCASTTGCSNTLSPLCDAIYGKNAPCPYNVPHYMDSITYNLPFGTNVAPGGTALRPQWYLSPNSNTNRGPLAPLPLDQQDLTNNDTGIAKLQFTHPLNSRAFIRAYGYSFFSDWTEDGQMGAYSYDLGIAPISPNYNLITHTLGGQLQFADQVTDQDLVQLTGNYTYANTIRENNTGFLTVPYYPLEGCSLAAQASSGCAAQSPVGLIAQNPSGQWICYDPKTGDAESCVVSGTTHVGGSWESTPFTLADAVPLPPAGSPAAKAGAQWRTLWNGNISATYNNVKPQFWNLDLSDEWRPNDQFVINAEMRYDDYDYGLSSTNNAQNVFWGQFVQNYTCWKGSAGTMLLQPLGPGVFPPPSPLYYQTCPAGFSHPGSAWSVNSPPTYNMYYWEPRYSITYTLNPDTVLRFHGGRYAEPPLTAAVQYFNYGGNAASLWANFLNGGFTSPFHPIPGETSAQYDLSLEKHIRGTDMSFKLTPFYGLTSNWEQQSFIGAGFVTQVPVGRYENYGTEFEFDKGDFSRNGLSGKLAFTWTHAYTQYQSGIVPNQITTLNKAILNYDCLTKVGYSANSSACTGLGYSAPSLCYEAGSPASCAAKPICVTSTGKVVPCGTAGSSIAYTPVLNAYYGDASQPLQDPNGWYPGTIYQLQPALGPGYGIYAQGYASPYTVSGILNYRQGRWAITPSVQWEAGVYYGSPMDFYGVDPRVCNLNQGITGVASGNNPLDCNYTKVSSVGVASAYGYLYIPNPATGSFANIGQWEEPNIAIGNMQISYDASANVKLQATLTNIFHVCWGGEAPAAWTSTYGPGAITCGYNTNTGFVGTQPGKGWFNGSSPTNLKSNGVSPQTWQLQPYSPTLGNGIGGYFPFNAYFSAQVRI